ncbi:MAG: glycosyltransferase, partial [Candidatus Dadabacteria bacterium]
MAALPDQLDLIVGIPSWKEADTIGHVVEVVDRGIQTYFPDLAACIVNVDNNSPDGTREAFLGVETTTPKQYISTPDGIRGKGHNFANLFRLFSEHGARIGIVVDADLRSITPEWIRKLGEPILKGADYVTPLYARHQFDGTITNHLCYPLTSALTDLEIRQPIGGEFSFGARFCERMTTVDWPPTAYEYGIDIFMTLNAILAGMDIRQTVLGSKIHKASAPKLGPMFTQVATTLFSMLAEHRDIWFESALQPGAMPLWRDSVHAAPVV